MNNNKNLPMELINKILIMRPPHPIVNIINDLIINCYDEEQEDETFYEYYFYNARSKYYEGPSNRYGNIQYLFDIENYYNNYKD